MKVWVPNLTKFENSRLSLLYSIIKMSQFILSMIKMRLFYNFPHTVPISASFWIDTQRIEKVDCNFLRKMFLQWIKKEKAQVLCGVIGLVSVVSFFCMWEGPFLVFKCWRESIVFPISFVLVFFSVFLTCSIIHHRISHPWWS